MMGEETRRVFILKDGDEEWLKCYGCGWRVSRLFLLAPSKEVALELYKAEEAGLCGDCFSEMLALDFDRPLTIAGKGCLIEVSRDG